MFQIHERLKSEYLGRLLQRLNHTTPAVLARNRSENNGASGTLSSTPHFVTTVTRAAPGRVIQMTLAIAVLGAQHESRAASASLMRQP
jgi:hypothetical protein